MLTRIKNQPVPAFLRYGLLFLQFVSYYFVDTYLSLDRAIVFLLLFICNQLRLYWGKHTGLSFSLNTAVEFLLLTLIPPREKALLLFCWLPVFFDILLSDLKNELRAALLLSGMGLLLYLSQPLNKISLLCFIGLALLLVLFAFLSMLLKREEDTQKELISLRCHIREELRPANQLQTEMRSREKLAILRERNRISRDIHDSVGHGLSTVIIQLSAIEKIAPSEPEKAAEMAHTLAEFTRDSLEQIRLALRELKPEAYSAYELVFLLDDICRKNEDNNGIRTQFRYSGEITKVSEKLANSILAIVREFFTNSRRHAEAKNLQLHLHFTPRELILNLSDDGKGAAPGFREGIGLKSMSERSRELGGTFTIQTAAGEGFKTRMILPLTTEEKLSHE